MDVYGGRNLHGPSLLIGYSERRTTNQYFGQSGRKAKKEDDTAAEETFTEAAAKLQTLRGNAMTADMDPKAAIGQFRQTLKNAEKLGELRTGKTDTPFETAEKEHVKLRDTFRSRLKGFHKYMLLVGAGFAALCGYGTYKAANYDNVRKEIYENTALSSSEQDEMVSQLIRPEAWASVLAFPAGLSGFLILLIGSVGAAEEAVAVRNAFKKAKELGKTSLKLNLPSRVRERQFTDFLARKIDLASAALAQRIQTQYEEKEVYRSYYDKVFKSEDGKLELPNAKTIRQLFEYYAYQQVLAEQGVKSRDGSEMLDQSDFYLKVLGLLKTSQKMGDLFGFLEERPGQSQNQGFKRTLTKTVENTQSQVEQDLLALKGLVTKEAALERQIETLQMTMAPVGMSELPGKEAVDKLEVALQELLERQKKIRDFLERDDDGIEIDKGLLAEIEVSVGVNKNTPRMSPLDISRPSLKADFNDEALIDFLEILEDNAKRNTRQNS